MTTETKRMRSGHWRLIAWGAAGGLLLVPYLARAPWTLSDYLIAGGMLGGAGLVLELLLRVSGNLAYKAGAALAVLASVLLFWVNGAVGFLGDEGNPANLLFLGVIAITVVGSVFAQFRARGMAVVMFLAAAAQAAVAIGGLLAGWASPGPAGLYEVALGTCLFGSMWLVSAGLFRKAAADEAAAAMGERTSRV